MVPKRIDIHNFDKRYDSSIRRLQEDKELSKKNKQIIQDYVVRKKNKGVIGLSRAEKIIEILKPIAKIIKKDLDRLTLSDRDKILETINGKENYTEWTKSTYKTIFKTFLKDTFPKNPDLWDFQARIKKKDIPKISKSELLTQEDIDRLLNACENMRDKAMISLFWESGARISEIGNMRIKNISFDDDCTTVNLAKGKTGTRTIFVIEATSYLAMWIKQHPLNQDNNAPLWINMGRYGDTKNQAIGYRTFYKHLERIFKRAGVKKKYNPHLFRHSRATFLATKGWSQQQLNKFFGWTPDSGMASVYISMCDEDVKDGVRQLYGLKKKETLEERKPKICPRCRSINEHNGRYCYTCGFTLDEDVRREKRLTLLTEASKKKIDLTNAEEMIALGQKLVEMGKFSQKNEEKE